MKTLAVKNFFFTNILHVYRIYIYIRSNKSLDLIYVDATWGRSVNCILYLYRAWFSRLQKLGLCLGKGNVSKKIQEPSCEYESKE